MKHTPGPWTRIAGERFRHDQSAGVTEPGGNYIAAALDRNRFDLDEEVEANARLIASAPELLAACEAQATLIRDLLKLASAEQIRDIGMQARLVNVSDQVCEALDKARGEST